MKKRIIYKKYYELYGVDVFSLLKLDVQIWYMTWKARHIHWAHKVINYTRRELRCKNRIKYTSLNLYYWLYFLMFPSSSLLESGRFK